MLRGISERTQIQRQKTRPPAGEKNSAERFGVDDNVVSGLKEEINLLAAKFPLRRPPCCLL